MPDRQILGLRCDDLVAPCAVVASVFLFRAVVATPPIEDHPQGAIGGRLDFVSSLVTMLLAVSHHDGKFLWADLDRVLLSVHRAKPEHCPMCLFAARIHSHALQNHRRGARSQG